MRMGIEYRIASSARIDIIVFILFVVFSNPRTTTDARQWLHTKPQIRAYFNAVPINLKH